jgi:membrane protein
LRLPRPDEAVAAFGFACLRRFIAIEGTLQGTVLGAQAFTSLIPFMVVASAVAPGDSDMADGIVERFGLEGNSAKSVHQLFASAGETESAVTWISIVILLLSVLSFTRALQRLFQRAYGRQSAGMKEDTRRELVWVLMFAAWITITSPLRGWLEDVGGVVFAVVLATVTGFFVWLATPLALLGERNWRRLAPGAAVSGLLGALLGVASSIYVPIAMDWSADKYGLIGIAFALQSFLLVFAFVIVIGAVVGATVVEQLGDLNLRRLRARIS